MPSLLPKENLTWQSEPQSSPLPHLNLSELSPFQDDGHPNPIQCWAAEPMQYPLSHAESQPALRCLRQHRGYSQMPARLLAQVQEALYRVSRPGRGNRICWRSPPPILSPSGPELPPHSSRNTSLPPFHLPLLLDHSVLYSPASAAIHLVISTGRVVWAFWHDVPLLKLPFLLLFTNPRCEIINHFT